MKHKLLSLIVIAVILPTAAHASPFASPFGYHMEIPAGWGVSAPGGNVDVLVTGPLYRPVPKLSDTKVAPTIRISVTVLKYGAPVDDSVNVTRSVAQLQKEHVGFVKTVDGQGSLGTLPGTYVEGIFDATDRMTLRQLQGVGDGKLFTLTETCLASDKAALDTAFSDAESSFTLAPFDTQAYWCPFGFLVTPPDGWKAHAEVPPDLVTFVEDVDDPELASSVRIRAKPDLPIYIDEDIIAANRDMLNRLYAREPGYTPIDQGMMLVGGEKAFYTVWSETTKTAIKRARKWHVIYPRDGYQIEIFVSYPESSHQRYDQDIKEMFRGWTWCPPRSMQKAS